jgi:hypothetical protein
VDSNHRPHDYESCTGCERRRSAVKLGQGCPGNRTNRRSRRVAGIAGRVRNCRRLVDVVGPRRCLSADRKCARPWAASVSRKYHRSGRDFSHGRAIEITSNWKRLRAPDPLRCRTCFRRGAALTGCAPAPRPSGRLGRRRGDASSWRERSSDDRPLTLSAHPPGVGLHDAPQDTELRGVKQERHPPASPMGCLRAGARRLVGQRPRQ